jgi:hypothetical protein
MSVRHFTATGHDEGERQISRGRQVQALTPESTGESVSDDRPTVERLRHGDRDALAELYRRDAGTLYWNAYGVLRSRPDAEEITADAFLTLWRTDRPWRATRARQAFVAGPSAGSVGAAEKRRPDRSSAVCVGLRVVFTLVSSMVR